MSGVRRDVACGQWVPSYLWLCRQEVSHVSRGQENAGLTQELYLSDETERIFVRLMDNQVMEPVLESMTKVGWCQDVSQSITTPSVSKDIHKEKNCLLQYPVDGDRKKRHK